MMQTLPRRSGKPWAWPSPGAGGVDSPERAETAINTPVKASSPPSAAGGFDTTVGFVSFILWSGLDIGRDRASPVSHYEAPFAFNGLLRKVTMVMDDDQDLDAGQAADATLATE